MGRINFAELRAQAPLEALVGVSGIARGIYLYIADFYGKSTAVTTSSELYNTIMGTAFLVAGSILMYGALRNYLPFRFVGLVLVGLETAFVGIKRIIEDPSTLTLMVGNITLLAVCIILLVMLVKEET